MIHEVETNQPTQLKNPRMVSVPKGLIVVDSAAGVTAFAGAQETTEWQEADRRVRAKLDGVAGDHPEANRYYLESQSSDHN